MSGLIEDSWIFRATSALTLVATSHNMWSYFKGKTKLILNMIVFRSGDLVGYLHEYFSVLIWSNRNSTAKNDSKEIFISVSPKFHLLLLAFPSRLGGCSVNVKKYAWWYQRAKLEGGKRNPNKLFKDTCFLLHPFIIESKSVNLFCS